MPHNARADKSRTDRRHIHPSPIFLPQRLRKCHHARLPRRIHRRSRQWTQRIRAGDVDNRRPFLRQKTRQKRLRPIQHRRRVHPHGASDFLGRIGAERRKPRQDTRVVDQNIRFKALLPRKGCQRFPIFPPGNVRRKPPERFAQFVGQRVQRRLTTRHTQHAAAVIQNQTPHQRAAQTSRRARHNHVFPIQPKMPVGCHSHVPSFRCADFIV